MSLPTWLSSIQRLHKSTIGILLLWKASVLAVALFAMMAIPLKLAFTPTVTEHGIGLPYLIWIWGNFDALHYMGIAVKGYEELTQPFFPLFPLSMTVVHALFGIPTLLSGLLISHICFLLALVAVYKLVEKDWPGHWVLLLSLLLLFPSSMFYGAVYNDSLFFMLATWSVWQARSRRWLLASVLAALAMLARLNGLALFGFLFAEFWTSQLSTQNSWQISQLWKETQEIFKKPKHFLASGILAAFLVPFSFISYLGYVQYKFGDWHKLFAAMAIWKQANPTFPPVVFLRYAKIFLSVTPLSLNFWVAAVETTFILFYIALAIWGWGKVRLSYWLLFVATILIPWTTGTFQGMPRYGLHIFPFFLLLALWFHQAKQWQKIEYIIMCIVLAIFIISCFTRGYFVT